MFLSQILLGKIYLKTISKIFTKILNFLNCSCLFFRKIFWKNFFETFFINFFKFFFFEKKNQCAVPALWQPSAQKFWSTPHPSSRKKIGDDTKKQPRTDLAKSGYFNYLNSLDILINLGISLFLKFQIFLIFLQHLNFKMSENSEILEISEIRLRYYFTRSMRTL